jgi:hypothetical protein
MTERILVQIFCLLNENVIWYQSREVTLDVMSFLGDIKINAEGEFVTENPLH